MNNMNSDLGLYAVGGFVRDVLMNKYDKLGITYRAKDLDFSVPVGEYIKDYDDLIQFCYSIDNDCDIKFRDTPELREREKRFGRLIVGFNTNKLGWSAEQWEKMHNNLPKKLYCDVLLSRNEGDYRDGRHPEYVKFCSLNEDLKRRDFTINSLAVDDRTGEVIDLFDGIRDIKNKTISTIRDEHDTFSEHIIRVLRALRFCVTRGCTLDNEIWTDLFINSKDYANLLKQDIFESSIREELNKMFKFNTPLSLSLIYSLPREIQNSLFNKIWLKATVES